MINLEFAIRLATNLHAGQTDQAGMPYILHPLHVMNQMDTIDEMIIAVLHDVIEDTECTADDLLRWDFDQSIVDDICLLSKDKGTKYDDYITAIKGSPRATKVKLADMRHNSDLTRIHVVEDKHMRMIKKYHKATIFLLDRTVPGTEAKAACSCDKTID